MGYKIFSGKINTKYTVPRTKEVIILFKWKIEGILKQFIFFIFLRKTNHVFS